MSQEIIFLHIGKNGGSFFKDLIKINKLENRIFVGTHSAYSEKFTSMDNLNKKYIFFVRDPVKRFISAYNHQYFHYTKDYLSKNEPKNVPCFTKEKYKKGSDFI